MTYFIIIIISLDPWMNGLAISAPHPYINVYLSNDHQWRVGSAKSVSTLKWHYEWNFI